MDPQELNKDPQQQCAIKPIISPEQTESDDEEFIVIEGLKEEEPVTEFAVEDKEAYEDIFVDVIDYVCEKSFVVLMTEKYVLRIKRYNQHAQQTRTVGDMNWLRNTLMLQYPGFGIPVFVVDASSQNLVKEKCVVAQKFLNYLLKHQTLKYCPQLKAFISDRIQYLEMKKQTQANSWFPKSKFNLSEIKSILSVITWSHSAVASTPLSVPNLNMILAKELSFRTSVQSLQGMLNYINHTNQLTKALAQAQMLLLANTSVDQQSSMISNQIKESIQKNLSLTLQSQSRQFLQQIMQVQITKQNLKGYVEWFDVIRNLEHRINRLKVAGRDNQAYSRQTYLKLLVNNMMRDMERWSQFNNQSVQRAVQKSP